MATAKVIESSDSRSRSPILPKDDATEPGEEAHQDMDCDVKMFKDTEGVKEKMEISSATEIKATDEVDGDLPHVDSRIGLDVIKTEDILKTETSEQEMTWETEKKQDVSSDQKSGQDSIITEQMIKEEEKLKKEGEEQERKMHEEQEQLWKQMAEEDREQRYNRLKFLLSKSNLYTEYLLERMKRQNEEDAKKKELADKRRKKRQEKLKMEKEQKTEEGTCTPVKSQVTNNADASPKAGDTAPSLNTKRPTRGRAATSDNSQGNAPSGSQESVKKRGRKRKTDAVEGADISNFFKQSQKKKKLQDGSAEEINAASDKDTNKNHDNVDSGKMDAKESVTEKSTSSDENKTEDEDDDEETGFSQPALFTGGTLRQYQIDGYCWLKTLYENGVNGILADEMGLGKTVQCIAVMAHLVSMGVPGPYLVVAPLSTLPNWHNEFRRFAPKVPVILYHGTKDERMVLRRKIRKGCPIRPGVEVMPVVITSYEMSMLDRKYLMNHEWKYLIVDEGHRIKNTHCRLIRELRMYRNTHRLLLTGTPLQNNLAELWSLLNFLLPEIFDDLGSFEAWFDVERMSSEGADEAIVKEEQQKNILSMLHQILTPFMLRRLKADVELLIPPKKEIVVFAPLTEIQKEFYSATVNRTIINVIEEKKGPKKQELNDKGRPVRVAAKKKVDYNLMVESPKDSAGPKKRSNAKARDEEEIEDWIKAMIDMTAPVEKEKVQKTSQITIRLQNIMMQLRKCCNHPYLLEYPLDPKTGEYKIDKNIISTCGKMMLLDRMLAELKAKGHKVLLFSQMTKMLDILQDYCHYKKYSYCRLDGSYSFQERQQSMDAFNTDPEMFIFLLSTRAGGLGINLTAADTVIIYDSDWNPQCDLQAQDRCHRIGQSKPVIIYRYVTANTIDQRIVERAAAKRKLEKMVIHKGKFKSGMKDFNASIKPLSSQELLDLLKSQDHDQEMKGRDGNVISAKDLASILDRSDLYEQWSLMKEEKEGKEAKKKQKKKTVKDKKQEVAGVFRVLEQEEGATNSMEEQEEKLVASVS